MKKLLALATALVTAAGISVVQIGHSHPGWVAAVQEQAGRLAHVGNLFYTEPAMQLAERLSRASLGGKAFFTNSGAEAVECALKLSRKERARLAQRLISSLDQGVDADTERLWLAEAERRLAELKSGKVTAIPADKVVKKVRSALR